MGKRFSRLSYSLFLVNPAVTEFGLTQETSLSGVNNPPSHSGVIV